MNTNDVDFQMRSWKEPAFTRECVNCGKTFPANRGVERKGIPDSIYACSTDCARAYEEGRARHPSEEASAMQSLADEFQRDYKISDEEIDRDTFGLFDHVTGRSLTADSR